MKEIYSILFLFSEIHMKDWSQQLINLINTLCVKSDICFPLCHSLIVVRKQFKKYESVSHCVTCSFITVFCMSEFIN